VKSAERPGFEPGVGFNPYAALAKRGGESVTTAHDNSLEFDANRLTGGLTGAGANPCERVRVTDPELARVIDAWATLPDPIRRAVMALIGTSTRTKSATMPSRRKRS
jgi:hypothetical protein